MSLSFGQARYCCSQARIWSGRSLRRRHAGLDAQLFGTDSRGGGGGGAAAAVEASFRPRPLLPTRFGAKMSLWKFPELKLAD
jgi:hypothetical protein